MSVSCPPGSSAPAAHLPPSQRHQQQQTGHTTGQEFLIFCFHGRLGFTSIASVFYQLQVISTLSLAAQRSVERQWVHVGTTMTLLIQSKQEHRERQRRNTACLRVLQRLTLRACWTRANTKLTADYFCCISNKSRHRTSPTIVHCSVQDQIPRWML